MKQYDKSCIYDKYFWSNSLPHFTLVQDTSGIKLTKGFNKECTKVLIYTELMKVQSQVGKYEQIGTISNFGQTGYMNSQRKISEDKLGTEEYLKEKKNA